MQAITLRPPTKLLDRLKALLNVLLLLCIFGVAFAEGLQFSEKLFSWVEGKYGIPARQRVENLQALIEQYSNESEARKVEIVNDFFNKVRYNDDNVLWDRKDYWATPFEVLGINSADCEDYALSKYFTLLSMGVVESKMRITYVKAIKLGVAHMVLAYYPKASGEPLILDNLTNRIKRASKRRDLVPVYSFNGAALWLSVNRVEGKKVGGSDRISLWKKFQKKLNRQMGE